MSVAFAVKYAMDALINEDDLEGVYVEAYSNGREQGLHIKGPGGSASFSENRNSDSIVIYVSRLPFHGLQFHMQGNYPSEEIYLKNRVFFDWHCFSDAARFILSMVLDGETSYGYEQDRPKYTLRE